MSFTNLFLLHEVLVAANTPWAKTNFCPTDRMIQACELKDCRYFRENSLCGVVHCGDEFFAVTCTNDEWVKADEVSVDPW